MSFSNCKSGNKIAQGEISMFSKRRHSFKIISAKMEGNIFSMGVSYELNLTVETENLVIY